MTPTMRQSSLCVSGIPSWTSSANSKWYCNSLPAADSPCGSNQWYSRWWLQFHRQIHSANIQHPSQGTCLPLCYVLPYHCLYPNYILGECASGPGCRIETSCYSCSSWCWDNLTNTLWMAGVYSWISLPNDSFTFCRSTSDNLIACCQVPLWCTPNSLHFVVLTITARYAWTSIAVQILSIIHSCNWWHSLSNCLLTLACTGFNIVWWWDVLFIL